MESNQFRGNVPFFVVMGTNHIFNDLKPIFNYEIPKDLKVVSKVSRNVFITYPTTNLL